MKKYCAKGLYEWKPGEQENNNKRQFALKLSFHYTEDILNEDGEVIEDPEDVTVSFNPDTDTSGHWQYASIPAAALGAYDSITVELVYDYNGNTACFDGIQLYKEVFGTSYTYDDKGNVISTVDLQKQNTTYEYNTNNDLTAIIQDGNVKMSYEYDNYRNVTKATTELDQVYEFTYDTYGNNTSVKITQNGITMQSSVTYTTDGHRVAETTDALGNITYYDYNVDTGLLNWVQYPEDTEATRTEYEYDSMYRTAQVAMTTDTGLALRANYTYNDGLLATIQPPSTTYSFDYGVFDLRTKVQVGSRTLAEYEYDNYNRLIELDYGNEDKVQYEYDSLGRVTKEIYLKDNETESDDFVAYSYDNDGNLATVYDSATQITTTYYYDLLGRALYYTKTGANGQTQIVQYAYDEKNNLTGLTESVGNSTQGYVYTYDENERLISMTVGDTTVSYTYDDFRRLTQKLTTQGETEVKRETYTYFKPTETTTSTQIAEYRVVAGGRDVTYLYTYDENGNILTIGEKENNITKTIRYEYDAANQLTAEYNEAEAYAHFWTYDNAGNILSRTEYAYVDGVLGEVTDTINYAYNDATWGDLLTSYDGQEIEYDGIGNPEEWGSRTFTWQHGRQLATLTEGTTTWNYTYGSDGMRTGRTNGATTYSYVYNGSQLVQMTVGSNVLRFTYDAAGTPLTVTYNGTTYYYTTNLQGDVVGIVAADGTELVRYTYSSWGVVLLAEVTATGDAAEVASALAELNPLQYRGYVYDTETALYYLQTRYYDPMVGRFINADAITSTGQGFAGNNMFSYCNNNPVCFYDAEGEVPQAVTDKMVHDWVLAEICKTNTDLRWHKTCIYYNRRNSRGGWGFCDLYNSITGEVWELKKNSNSPSCTHEAATAQLNNYVSGALKAKLSLPLSTPTTTIIQGGSFIRYDGEYVYNVEYWYEGEGIIRYDYQRTQKEKAYVKSPAYNMAPSITPNKQQDEALAVGVLLVLVALCIVAPAFA